MRLVKIKFFALKSKLLLLALLALAMIALPATALAHPLGNFTVNHYSRIEVGAAGVNIFYVLDMAEIPAFQEKDIIDLNKDGQLSAAEQSRYLEAKLKEIRSNLKLTVDGKAVELNLVSKDLAFLAGQGGLQTLRLAAHLQTPALADRASNLTYRDTNYPDRLGWREIVLRSATGVALTQSSVSDRDQTNELRVYPEDMLASPLAVTSASAAFKIDPSVVVNRTDFQPAAAAVKTQEPLANLINGELTVAVVAFALVASIILGMFHALSPGHGKTVVAAYLVGSRGTARHAVFLGLTVTITHTIGVFVLGLITLFASQYILPEKLYPWLGLLSGLLVLGMGVALFRSRLNFARLKSSTGSTATLQASGHTHSHSSDPANNHNHQHGHDHPHDHQHGHDHPHDHDHDHSHKHFEPAKISQPEPALALAAAGSSPQGVDNSVSWPTTGLPGPETAHPPTHDHDHDHPQHEHKHPHQKHNHDHEYDHGNGLIHSHGGKPHTHLPPGADGKAVTWKNLLIFGISAGLLPCPSALVLMLSAIALNRTALGLIMIIFFSFGLAGTLTLIGLLLVYAREKLGKLKLGRAGKVVRLLPVASAALVSILGMAITYEGLIQIGLLK
jgi:nickel/cobalt exporter